jgi:hypothetical protein
MSVAHVDNKGRLVLGRKFAGKTVLLREVDECTVEVTMARVISEHEAWLLNNPEARRSVSQGLNQASKGNFAPPPDLESDKAFADKLAD